MNTYKTVYFFTQAFNAEKTLSRTIESVLAQSYTNIIYYIADSASTDTTKEIILHYANKDDRIRPIFLPENTSWEIYNILPKILAFDYNGYFVQIDADDEYLPNFTEKVLRFMEIHDLDIGSCTSKYINGITGEDISKSHMKKDLFVEDKAFQSEFPNYFKFFRDSWGKIFSLEILNKLSYENFNKNIMTGSVTYLPFEALLYSKRVGVLHEALHKYYLYPDSFERNPKNLGRILTPTLYTFYYNFLVRKCGFVSYENKEYLFQSYCNAINNKIKGLNLTSLSKDDLNRLSSIIKDNELTTFINEHRNTTYITTLNNLISLIDKEF